MANPSSIVGSVENAASNAASAVKKFFTGSSKTGTAPITGNENEDKQLRDLDAGTGDYGNNTPPKQNQSTDHQNMY